MYAAHALSLSHYRFEFLRKLQSLYILYISSEICLVRTSKGIYAKSVLILIIIRGNYLLISALNWFMYMHEVCTGTE